MQKKIIFHGQERTPVIDTYINDQLAKIERFLENERSPKMIEMAVEFHKLHQHNKVTGRVKSPSYDCFAEHEGPDLHIEINEVIDRLYTQLRAAKEKMVDKHKHGCNKDCRMHMNEEPEEEGDEE